MDFSPAHVPIESGPGITLVTGASGIERIAPLWKSKLSRKYYRHLYEAFDVTFLRSDARLTMVRIPNALRTTTYTLSVHTGNTLVGDASKLRGRDHLFLPVLQRVISALMITPEELLPHVLKQGIWYRCEKGYGDPEEAIALPAGYLYHHLEAHPLDGLSPLSDMPELHGSPLVVVDTHYVGMPLQGPGIRAALQAARPVLVNCVASAL